MLRGINPGALDTYITIESATQTKNSIGENETTWSVLRSVHSEWHFKNSPEGFEGLQAVGSMSAEVKIRFDESITSTMRLKRNGETAYYYIRSVQRWRREGSTVLMVEKRDNE